MDLKKKKIIYLFEVACSHVECFIFAYNKSIRYAFIIFTVDFIIFTVDLSRGDFSSPPPDH